MLRLVDVRKALEARGYPEDVRAEVHLDVVDDLLPANAGPLVLRVEDGVGRVAPGGKGTVRVDVRTLAPLYTGFVSPAQARVAYGIEASTRDAARLTSVFAGSEPWIQDAF